MLPKYCEEVGNKIPLSCLLDVDGNWSLGCLTISTLANWAGVFPSFSTLPTKLGVFPMYLMPKLFVLNCIDPTTIAPRLKDADFTSWLFWIYCIETVKNTGLLIRDVDAKTSVVNTFPELGILGKLQLEGPKILTDVFCEARVTAKFVNTDGTMKGPLTALLVLTLKLICCTFPAVIWMLVGDEEDMGDATAGASRGGSTCDSLCEINCKLELAVLEEVETGRTEKEPAYDTPVITGNIMVPDTRATAHSRVMHDTSFLSRNLMSLNIYDFLFYFPVSDMYGSVSCLSKFGVMCNHDYGPLKFS